MSDFLKLVGSKVRIVRKAKGLTQEELAEKCGLQYTYIGGIERGVRNVSLQTIEKLAEGLGAAPFELLQFKEVDPQDIFNDKRALVESLRNLLLDRSEEEIRTIHNIAIEILKLRDIKVEISDK
jgi:transcriptional regulator with XRE-family HTH domain